LPLKMGLTKAFLEFDVRPWSRRRFLSGMRSDARAGAPHEKLLLLVWFPATVCAFDGSPESLVQPATKDPSWTKLFRYSALFLDSSLAPFRVLRRASKYSTLNALNSANRKEATKVGPVLENQRGCQRLGGPMRVRHSHKKIDKVFVAIISQNLWCKFSAHRESEASFFDLI